PGSFGRGREAYRLGQPPQDRHHSRRPHAGEDPPLVFRDGNHHAMIGLGDVVGDVVEGQFPIVMTTAIDPVGAGLVASLARPGGNVTGCAVLYTELSTKRLQILMDVISDLTRVIVLLTASHLATSASWIVT